jgi:hypothetical protein
MSDTQLEMTPARRLLKIFVRLLMIVMLAFCIGWILNQVAHSLEKSHRPAGFARGLLQGALMPMSMPNLLVGNNVTIYAENNTGVSYKLGYTTGVNGCGAIFFGFFFWRLRRLKKWATASKEA